MQVSRRNLNIDLAPFLAPRNPRRRRPAYSALYRLGLSRAIASGAMPPLPPHEAVQLGLPAHITAQGQAKAAAHLHNLQYQAGVVGVAGSGAGHGPKPPHHHVASFSSSSSSLVPSTSLLGLLSSFGMAQPHAHAHTAWPSTAAAAGSAPHYRQQAPLHQAQLQHQYFQHNPSSVVEWTSAGPSNLHHVNHPLPPNTQPMAALPHVASAAPGAVGASSDATGPAGAAALPTLAALVSSAPHASSAPVVLQPLQMLGSSRGLPMPSVLSAQWQQQQQQSPQLPRDTASQVLVPAHAPSATAPVSSSSAASFSQSGLSSGAQLHHHMTQPVTAPLAVQQPGAGYPTAPMPIVSARNEHGGESEAPVPQDLVSPASTESASTVSPVDSAALSTSMAESPVIAASV